MNVRMSCNYIMPERDDIVSLVFQTEPGRKYTDVHVKIRYQNSYDVFKNFIRSLSVF